MSEIPDKFLEILRSVTAKRAKTVIDHILAKGYITTEELKEQYGYAHPPRGARDVREQGIPLETFKVKGADGRSIAAYRFGDVSKVESHKFGGRRAFSKQLGLELYADQGGRCGICDQVYERRYLQIDHRVPYEIGGDQAIDKPLQSAFMLICGSCQRSKSWTCEHCQNWFDPKLSEICHSCYWANPTAYSHIAMRDQKRVEIVWSGEEIKDYERLRRNADRNHNSISEEIKLLLKRGLSK